MVISSPRGAGGYPIAAARLVPRTGTSP